MIKGGISQTEKVDKYENRNGQAKEKCGAAN